MNRALAPWICPPSGVWVFCPSDPQKLASQTEPPRPILPQSTFGAIGRADAALRDLCGQQHRGRPGCEPGGWCCRRRQWQNHAAGGRDGSQRRKPIVPRADHAPLRHLQIDDSGSGIGHQQQYSNRGSRCRVDDDQRGTTLPGDSGAPRREPHALERHDHWRLVRWGTRRSRGCYFGIPRPRERRLRL